MKYYKGLSENVIGALEKRSAIPKPILSLIDKCNIKHRGTSWPVEKFKILGKLCDKHGITCKDAFEASVARNSLKENRKGLKQNEATFKGVEEFLVDFLTHNLFIEVNEESYGFNGNSLEIKLLLKNKVISESSYTLKEDEG